MGLTISGGGGNAFRRVPTGVWVARAVRLVDLGTQKVEFAGEIKHQRKLLLTWEVFGEDEHGVPLTVEGQDGKEVPMSVSKRYTASMNERSRLRADLEAWRGKPFTVEELKSFDVRRVLGTYCMLNVIEQDADNGKTYSNIQSITPLPAALAKAKPRSDTPLVAFDLDQWDQATFDAFHESLQRTIMDSKEFKDGASRPRKSDAPFADVEDDIPL